MTSETDSGSDASNNDASNPLAEMAGSVVDMVTDAGIPKPVRDNALKAFSRLCSAAVDVPVAYLEGIAAERRAEADARVRLVAAAAQQLVTHTSVDAKYAAIAADRNARKIVREQANLDTISRIAAQDIRQPAQTQPDEAPSRTQEMDDDWLNAFEREASQKSSEEMQCLFGKILSGEIRKPSRFSIKTLKLAGELDGKVAQLFLRLCSCAVSFVHGGEIYDSRVVALGGNAGSNALAKYGLNFDQLNILNEYGLIIPDYNSHFDYKFAITDSAGKAAVAMTFQKKHWVLAPTSDRDRTQPFQLYGVRLSRAGNELLPILDLEPQPDYQNDLSQYFARMQLTFVPLTGPAGVA
jgi:hypothetical protein